MIFINRNAWQMIVGIVHTVTEKGFKAVYGILKGIGEVQVVRTRIIFQNIQPELGFQTIVN